MTAALLCALALLSAAAQEDRSLEVGVRASQGREANQSDFDWGPTLSLELLSSAKGRRSRFKYELELSYNDASTELRGEDFTSSTRVRSFAARYAKLSFLKLFGFDLRKRLGFVPYASSGVQYVDSREETDGEVLRRHYWSPTWGAGAEVALNKRLSLAVDYDRNMEGGERRVSRLSLELKVSLWGEEED